MANEFKARRFSGLALSALFRPLSGRAALSRYLVKYFRKGHFVKNLILLDHLRELKMGNFLRGKCLEGAGCPRPPPNYRLPMIVRGRSHLVSREERFQYDREFICIAHPGIVGALHEFLDLKRYALIGKGSLIRIRHDIIYHNNPVRGQKMDGVCEVAKRLLESMQSIQIDNLKHFAGLNDGCEIGIAGNQVELTPGMFLSRIVNRE